ncbi:MAG: hypothetical protein L0Z62_45915 [Gemmataceae bacterium]|nr:hypothetical protein [Gemmataceae bacterium]
MLAIARTLKSQYPGWHWFWDDLDEAELPWARTLSEDNREAFQLTVESMLRASIPPERMACLRALWSPLRCPNLSFGSDYTLRWNLMGSLEDSPNDTTDAQVESVMTELSPDEEGHAADPSLVNSNERKEQIAHFLKELKYSALCTLWEFVRTWACYTATLPPEAFGELQSHLFGIAAMVLLGQLS